jgi:type II secretory pathway pseudopilin PulG
MGQQQLLLVILVTIIVGIATVVAINTFSSAADSANLDAVRQDIASIAASSQGYYMKPDMLGGGGQDFTGMTFENITFGGTIVSGTPTQAYNENGTYVLGAGSAGSISITAHPSSCDGYGTAPSTACGSGDQLSATILPDNLSY